MSEFTPKTRLEKFLAKIAGRSEEELEPKTRLEAALDDIAENIGQGSGGSGGGSGGTLIVSISGEEGSLTADKTNSDILAAVNSGMLCAAIYEAEYYYLGNSDVEGLAIFHRMDIYGTGNDKHVVRRYIQILDNVVSYNELQI